MKQSVAFLVLLLFSVYAFAQATLVSYDLTSNGSGVDATYVDSRDFISVNTGTLNYTSNGAYATDWPTTNSQTDYFEITVKPESGYKLNITEIDFGERRSNTGIRDYQVRWSSDDFATSTTIATVNVPDNDYERTGDVTGLNITINDGDSIQIRWYGYNAEASGGTWRINNATLKVKGSVQNSSLNDNDTKADAPTTQIGVTNIASTVQSAASAVDVFKFKITDLGTADGKPTKVTRIRIKKLSGSQLLDDWIKGFVLKDGATIISIASVTAPGTAAYFDLNINSGDLDISNGSSKELTLGVYLESSVVDNVTFSFYIDANDNGFTADNLGSGFDMDFGTDINSSLITITVAATKMIFQTQPSNTTVSTVMNPSSVVTYVDAYYNVDKDIAGVSNSVTMTTTGTFDGTATTTVNPISGIAIFSNIIHSATDVGIYLAASSASSSYTSINSSNFNITLTPSNPSIDSLYISEVSDASVVASEFLELYNPSKMPIDLSSVSLVRLSSSGTVEYTIALSSLSGDLIIDSSSYWVISRGDNRTTFESNWASFPSSSAFMQGNNNLYFGSPTSRRWRITYDDGSIITTIDDTQLGQGGTNNTCNQVSKGSWASYTAPSNSTPGYRNTNSQLPIELLCFDVKLKNGNVELSWQTGTETNNDFFSIERAFDAEHFEVIANIIGAGNSNSQLSYSYDYYDVSQINILYYRLKQTDFDGAFTYSKTIALSLITDHIQLLKTYVNNDNLKLEINSPETCTAKFDLYNMNGQILKTMPLRIQEGNQNYSIFINQFPMGIYTLRIVTDTDKLVHRFFVH